MGKSDAEKTPKEKKSKSPKPESEKKKKKKSKDEDEKQDKDESTRPSSASSSAADDDASEWFTPPKGMHSVNYNKQDVVEFEVETGKNRNMVKWNYAERLTRYFMKQTFENWKPEDVLKLVGHDAPITNISGFTLHHSVQFLNAGYLSNTGEKHALYPDRNNTIQEVRQNHKSKNAIVTDFQPPVVRSKDYYIDSYDGSRLMVRVFWPTGRMYDDKGDYTTDAAVGSTETGGTGGFKGDASRVKKSLQMVGENNTFKFKKKFKGHRSHSSGTPPAVVLARGDTGLVWSQCHHERGHDGHPALAADLANIVYIVPKLRMAPEHRYPTQMLDMEAVFRWVHDNHQELGVDPARIGVAGENFGGSVAMGLCIKLRDENARDGEQWVDEKGDKWKRTKSPVDQSNTIQRVTPMPAFLFLISPFLDMVTEYPSWEQACIQYFHHAPDVKNHLLKLYLGETKHLLQHPWVSPGLLKDVKGMPPTVMCTAGFDAYRDAVIALKDRYAKQGVHYRFLLIPPMMFYWNKLAYSLSSEVFPALKDLFKDLNTVIEHI